MIVVDANVIAFAVIWGDKTDLTRTAWKRDAEWVVPLLCKHEMLNVIATACRSGVLTDAQGLEAWEKAVNLIGNMERAVDAERVLSMAIDKSVSAYDAQYMVLAKSLNIWCVTEDRKLQKVFPRVAISLRQFCSE